MVRKDERHGEAELSGRARDGESVFERHGQIEHGDVYGRVLQPGERLFAVGGFGATFNCGSVSMIWRKPWRKTG